MDFERVELKEKKVVGLLARTNNTSPDMGNVISGLWEGFYGIGIYSAIKNKSNDKSLGIYTDYAGKEMDDYSVIAACEVEAADEIPEGTVVRTIPAGLYAKFVVRGNMVKAVAEFWQELWKIDLPRAFVCDFEEYQNGDMEDALIHIYIGLKD
ncbi:GyrI-like domain-containing protein [Lacrimispora sp.]|uniref:GyrI-like domain-containing protein n=1 Tax=Lacrimispora sp. TaxID=2719234 RepID=UPI002897D21A|nr:GyrI-like domain-containing protein [Lacrimispora sp.]